MSFVKSTRKHVKIKIAITGPSGAGKTFSALRLASGIGNKIALIDTENGSASLYSEQFDFDVLELRPPFTPDKYIAAIKEAEKLKYDVLIIDSLSHEWEGEGGILQTKESLDQKGGNSFTNWGRMTKPHNNFTSTYLQADINIIATMRSKQDYVIEQNDKGKQIPKKIGLKPIQREGTEYEFTTIFDIDMAHEASVSKDRTGLFIDKSFKITEETGKEIKNWINSVTSVVEPEKQSLKSFKPDSETMEKVEKMFDITNQFNEKREFFFFEIERNIAVFCGDLSLTNDEIISFKNEVLNSFKEAYIKQNGKYDLDEHFANKLLIKRIKDMSAKFNLANDMKYLESDIKKLCSEVWNTCKANPDAKLEDVFLAKSALLMPF